MSHASPNPWERTQRLLGRGALARLATARVAVFGVGGVGSYVVEALVRSGVGHLLLVDADTVAVSDLNRQLHATRDTIGEPKVTVMARRARSINPAINVECRQLFYLPENAAALDLRPFDHIVDAVDTVSAKIELVMRAAAAATPLISCMGAGNKLDPSRFRVSDIYATTVCPLCRVMRRELRARGIKALPVVWSDEPPLPLLPGSEDPATPGSTPFVPPVAGFIAAAAVVRHLITPHLPARP